MDYTEREMVALGQNLRRLVKKSGMTAAQFSKEVGVINDTVMKWFAGKNVGFLKRSKKICEILGINTAQLHGENQGGRQEKMDKDRELDYLRGRVDALESIIETMIKSGVVNFQNGPRKKGAK